MRKNTTSVPLCHAKCAGRPRMVKKSGHTLLQTVTCSLSIALWLVFRRAIVHTPSRYEPPWQGGESDELDKAVDIYHGLHGPGTAPAERIPRDRKSASAQSAPWVGAAERRGTHDPRRDRQAVRKASVGRSRYDRQAGDDSGMGSEARRAEV